MQATRYFLSGLVLLPVILLRDKKEISARPSGKTAKRQLLCGVVCGLQAVTESTGLPRCPACGGLLKPEVVLYGEQLDAPTVEAAVAAIADAELVLVAGTSLAVYPAASFLRYCRGRLAVLNLTPTPVDARADVAVYADAAQAAERLQAMARAGDAPPAETR